MPIMTSQTFGVHKTHSAFPWGTKRAGGKPKNFPLFFYGENLHPPQPGWSCSQLHSAQRLQEQAELLSPRAWFCIPRTLSHPVAAQGPDPALSSLELYPDKRSCGTGVGFSPPELGNQPHRACSHLPSTARKTPLNPEGFGWVPTASARVQKRLVSYLYTNHKN